MPSLETRAQIITGVDFDESHQIAGIAAVYRGGRLISGDVVSAEDLLAAQLLAILRQVEITALPRCSPALICTDSPALYPCVRGEVEPSTPQGASLLDMLIEKLTRLDGKVHLATVEPQQARPAAIAARQTRKAWVAGLEGRCTWQSRNWKAAA